MLNTLVNSTGEGLCNSTSAYYKQSCIDEIFECIGTVACQTDMNTEALEQIHDSLQTTKVSATNVSADSVCTNSICTNAISTVGIEANNVQSQCLNVAGKATVGSIESNGIVKAESVQTESLSTENIIGLQSLTVEGGVWADDVRTDALEVNGKATAECIEADEVSTERLKSDIISTSEIGANSVVSDCFIGQEASIQKACVGSLSTSSFSSDEITTSKINSTSLSVPKLETSGGITGKGVIDTTSPVWKEIRIPLFTGMIQFYTDEWKVTINGGREFIWEDESLDHLKFLSNDGETVTVAVDWDGDVYYTYNVAKDEPVLSFVDNTGHTPDNDHTYIMQDSGIKRGTVFIYQDKEFTDQGLTILGKVKASNLEITCGESIDCLCVGNLCVGNSIISNNPIEVDICARSFCVSSPCTYIDNCLYADHLEAKCICTHRLYFDNIQVVCEAEKPKKVVVYKDGLLCSSCKVCADDDTVYSPKVCITGSPLSEGKSGFYGNLHGIADNSCCFDGRLFCDACFEILSGKACTAGLADNSCCFEGRTFAKACNEILSGKACKAELADFAQRTCIWCRWGQDDPGCYGYIPFADYVDKCLFFGRGDPNMANPFIVYNSYGLVCMELRGCLCLKDRPLIVDDSIDSDYMHTGWLNVKQNALITKLCSCNEYTERLCVNQCAKFHGPTYFYGNIYQCGASYCTHAQNIYTCSDTITMREGANFAGEAQIKVLKYDGANNGIIQLGTDGTLRIGDETNCQPVLTRSEEADICDGHVLVWDATNRCAKDGGEGVVTCDYVHCVGKECKSAACTYSVCVGTQCKTAACNYATSVGGQCKTAACNYATSVGTQCKTASCTFAVSCGHEIGKACKDAATSTKANCYGNSYNCVQCADLARKAILGAYTAPQKRFVYFGNPADATPIGCNPNFWYCPTCSILAITGADKTGSTLCLVGKGSCCMSGEGSKENPKIVFADNAGYCGCLQLSRYTCTHPGFGLCWMANHPLDSWIQTDCFYAKCYLDKDGNCLAGYTATVPSPAGNTRYVLLDLGKEDTMVDFQIYNSHGTIVKSTSESAPAGAIYQSNSYGINGYCMVDAVGSCVWLRLIGWRALNLWGSYPIKVVANTTTNPGCTWDSPTILPNCTYVSTVGTQCKSAACTYANTVAFCNVNTCKGIGVMGVARAVDASCWTKAGYWAYMTTKDGPNCCWNHVIKTDWNGGADVWASGISIPTYNAPQNGIHYKVRCCGGTTGWTLVPDITCVQNVGLSCRNLAESCACSFAVSCGHEIGTSCKNAATSTKANCYGNNYNCVACANATRKVDLEAYNATNKRFIYIGQPDAAKNIGCYANLWYCPTCNIMVMGSACGSALCLVGTGSCCVGGICSKLNPKIVFASLDNQCGCLQYTQYDGVHPGAGLCWLTNQAHTWFQTDCMYANKYLDADGVALPTCGYVSTVGGQCKSAACTYASSVGGQCKSASCSFAVSCGHEIGTACRSISEACACAFAATCAQSVVPETSTFAKCYGNSTSCVGYADQVRFRVSSNNTFYKIPFTTTITASANEPIYVDGGNVYPSYNPSTNVFCGYTVCVAQTLAVPNANGRFRLGNYCIYIA